MSKRDSTAIDLRRSAAAARDLIAALAANDAELAHDMTEGETGLFEAIDVALAELDECAVTIDGCKAREEVFKTRRERAERRQDTIRGHIEQALLVAGIGRSNDPVRRPTGTMTVSDTPPKPVVTDEAQIPSEYWRQPEPVLDRAKLNAAVKRGEQIPGVVMSNRGTKLTIRRA